MSRATLLNSLEPGFEFEHAMAHRNALGVMSPLTRFAIVPYFVFPMLQDDPPGGPWHHNHQQAHDDAANNLPSQFGSSTLGIAINASLLDYAFDNPDSREWWTFVNHIEHYVGGNTILPPAAPPPLPPAPQWTFPFW